MHRFLMLIVTCLPAVVFAQDTTQTVVPTTRDEITFSYAPVVKKVVPAVVNIYTRHVEKVATAPLSPLMDDPFFNQFFSNGLGGVPRERVVHSLGSGVIVGSDGTIVTSYHVVKGSEEINIVLSDKRELEGHVEKTDETSDLAVLKVDTKGKPLPYLELRDSDTLEVGDLVLAVGDPFGVGQTVTSGIISALARSEADVSDYQFFIQTDAAINPGNSGGALVDMQGRLIGINTAIYTRSGGYQGIGFAIPANMVKAVLNGRATKTGNIIHPWMGVAVQPVTKEIADAEGLEVQKGVLVKEVAAGSPAEKAGVKAGDIIISVGGSEVHDSQSLNFRIVTTGIGNATNVTVWRGNREIPIPITFTAQPDSMADDQNTTTFKDTLISGVSVAEITPAIARKLDIPDDQKGVVVVHGSATTDLGMSINTGDIIVAVNNTVIHNVPELKQALKARTHQFQITLLRGGMELTLSVSK